LRRRAILVADDEHEGVWVTSSPGSREVSIECLPESSQWAEELKKRGFPIEWLEEGQRIVPYATRQEVTINSDGTLAPLTAGSAQAVTTIVHHPGIVATKRFSFPAPW
jgi:hypothetical protein